MVVLNHPNIKGISVDVPDGRVADHKRAGWKPSKVNKSGKANKK